MLSGRIAKIMAGWIELLDLFKLLYKYEHVTVQGKVYLYTNS